MRFAVTLSFLATVAGSQAVCSAQTPAQVFNQCKAAATQIAQECSQSSQVFVQQTCTTIKNLIAQGNHELARQTAEMALASLENTLETCTTALKAGCKNCVQFLRSAGARRLAGKMIAFCAKTIAKVKVENYKFRAMIRKCARGCRKKK